MGLFREIKFELSFAVFAGGIVMSILATFYYFLSAQAPPFIRDANAGLGNWIFWVAVLGYPLALGGGYYSVDLLRKRRQFERLMSSPSKATFVRNQDKIERLAWILSSEYERRVGEKKREFKIRE